MASGRASSAFALLSCLILIGVCFQVEAQFFTKSSSKSIPRMGRRSEEQTISNQNRRLIIDSLIDLYGPNLLTALMRQDRAIRAKSQAQSKGELFYNNEQPMDANKYEPEAEQTVDEPMSREERSQNLGQKDVSLAMRAFNINRYMQHLASGQPLISYDKLITSNPNGPTDQYID